MGPHWCSRPGGHPVSPVGEFSFARCDLLLQESGSPSLGLNPPLTTPGLRNGCIGVAPALPGALWRCREILALLSN